VTGPGTVILLYHRPTHRWYKEAATVREHISAFRRHSRFAVWEINTDYGFPPGLDAVRPGAVVLHYSLFGSGVYRLDEQLQSWLHDRSDAVKIAFFQDEYYFCQKRFTFVNDFGVDVVYTHVGPEHIPEVWGRYTPRARALFNIPGYVDERMVAAAERFALPDGKRDIDVSYRGRPLPAHMGAGSQEKAFIGDRFKELAAGSGLRLDIDTSIEGRLYGDDWHRFLGRSRATLGVESGVSYIDLEDECHDEYLTLKAELGREPTLAELREGALGRWDGNIPYRTLGPRHFEAAAFRVCQVLFEGAYSGALEPGVHYVPLAKDFSNLDDAIGAIRDPARRRVITDRAYADLVASGHYSYRRFIAEVDEVLLEAGLRPGVSPGMRRMIQGSVRKRRHRLRLSRWVERNVALWSHLTYRVVAPVSLRMRRLLGLRVPPG
jgi:hypothetical protein